MAYYKKSHLIEAFNPDLILLQEVAKKDVVASDHPFAAWSGSNPHKGLGVLGVTKARYKVTEAADPSLPSHIPFSVDGLNILALWAHQHTKDLRYVRVPHEIVDRHADFLSEGSALLMGDFNSNTISDCNLTLPQRIIIAGEGVRLAAVARPALDAGIASDRDPRATPPPIVLASKDDVQWCRGAAVLAIQAFVHGTLPAISSPPGRQSKSAGIPSTS